MNFEICLINPNKTDILFNKIKNSALKVASPSTSILINKNNYNQNYYSEYYDESVNVSNLIKQIEENKTSDAFVITCFEDTGVDIARNIKSKLIVGVGEASFDIANLIGNTFSVITTLSRSNEAIKNNLIKYGLFNKCVSLTSIEVPVLDLETMSNLNLSKLKKEIKRTILEDKPDAIIICNPGMIDFTKTLEKEFEIPIIEGVSSAITIVESLLKLGFKINKLGFKKNIDMKYNGYFSKFLK